MNRTIFYAAGGVFYSLLLLAIALVGIHESALFLGVALAPFPVGLCYGRSRSRSSNAPAIVAANRSRAAVAC